MTLPPAGDFFRALLDAIPNATVAADPTGTIVFANPSAESMFGYRAGELAGKPIVSILPEGSPGQGIRQDGTAFAVALKVNSPDSLPGFSLLTIEECGLGSTDFRWVLESSPIGIAEIRTGGQVFKANDAFLALLGMTRTEFQREGLNVVDSTPPEWLELTTRSVQEGRETLRPVLYEKEYWRRDGSRVPVVICLSWRKEESGRALAFVLDLSAQKQIESELRTSEERNRTVVESLPGMVFTTDAAGGNTFTNRRYQDYTGMRAESLLGDGWLDMVHPGDRARAGRTWDASVRTGDAYEAEYRFRRNDGTYRWHLCRGLPLRDAGGNITAWFGNCTDVGEYKTIREGLEAMVQERTAELRKSEEQYRTLVTRIKDYAILMLDAEGRVASWNDCAERTKGYTAAEILGKHFSCFHPPEDVERGHPEKILRVAAIAGHYEEDGWRVRKDGSRFWANVSITALRNEAGELTGFSKVTRDITRRTLAEERLKQSEQKFRAVLESAPDAVIIADEDGQMVLVNAQAEHLFGYERAEMIGQPVEKLIPPGARERHTQNRANSAEPLTRPMGAGMMLKALRKDGTGFPVEVSLSPIQTPQGSWVAAAIRDVTERVLTENQLVAERKRAEEANRSKSIFLAAMSHEIRTPMNAILGMSDLLWESELRPEQRQYVEVFRRAGANLLILINDLLDLSKIEAGHFELERVPFNLGEVVDQAAELAGPRARKKGVGLSIFIAPEIRTDLIGDPARLRQVLINLLGNALKFTHEGEIRLEIREAALREAGTLDFCVTDTGIGIAAEKLEVIFDDFIQADSSTTRKYGGTGLGLGISRRIVELMGGQLTVTSVLGQGSRFGFQARFEAAASRIVQQEVADFHGKRVLVVDDNPTNRLILRETLAAWGLESRGFASGAEGLIEIAGNEAAYALVILDRNMPDMDGFAAAKRLRQAAPKVPIVMLSSETVPGDGVRWREAGLAEYALKPVKRPELFRIVCQALKCAARAASDSPQAAAAHPPGKGRPLRILVAEDAADNRLLVKAYLKGSPHQVTFVEDGKSAVDQFDTGAYDLILMDIQMPVMDGLTATQEIRTIEQSNGRGHIPIVALTAHAAQSDVETSLAAGCDLHLIKPISKQRLLKAIGQFSEPHEHPEPLTIQVPEGLEEIVPAYVADRRAEVAALRELCAASDFPQLAALAHNMKGTGLSFGLPDLSRIGKEMEQAAMQSDRGALGTCLAELAEYLGRVQVA